MTTKYVGSNGARRPPAKRATHELSYGFGKLLEGVDFEIAVETAVNALAEQGFGVVTQIDVQKTLNATLEVEFRRYVILAVCNPVLAKLALEVDPHIGLLLPCNVVVQEGAGAGLSVAVGSCQALFQCTHHPRLKFIAMETERRLRLAVECMS